MEKRKRYNFFLFYKVKKLINLYILSIFSEFIMTMDLLFKLAAYSF